MNNIKLDPNVQQEMISFVQSGRKTVNKCVEDLNKKLQEALGPLSEFQKIISIKHPEGEKKSQSHDNPPIRKISFKEKISKEIFKLISKLSGKLSNRLNVKKFEEKAKRLLKALESDAPDLTIIEKGFRSLKLASERLIMAAQILRVEIKRVKINLSKTFNLISAIDYVNNNINLSISTRKKHLTRKRITFEKVLQSLKKFRKGIHGLFKFYRLDFKVSLKNHLGELEKIIEQSKNTDENGDVIKAFWKSIKKEKP